VLHLKVNQRQMLRGHLLQLKPLTSTGVLTIDHEVDLKV